jgi:lipoate-protein ligase A
MGLAGRLLRTRASRGSINMGVDEALATLCRDRAILRFYAWDAPTLSIGYFQRTDEIDLEACHTSAVSLVRRPTGGRAVLHHRDLTYSLVLPLRPPWTEFSIADSYRRINSCLKRGLETLGLAASIGIASERAGHSGVVPSPFCFSAIARHEVLVAGKKVIGSAQRRFPGALLQQGSILLDFDPGAILALLGPGGRAATEGSLGIVGSLREALGWLPERAQVEAAISDGLAREMGVDFTEGALDPGELQLSDQLAADRYAAETWTFRR